MAPNLEKIYGELFSYCKTEDFAGHDPFDGLNSSLFQSTPLKFVSPARLAWLQMIKRSSKDLRSTLRVPKGVNPKGLALFVLAELSRFRASGESAHADEARLLADRLIETKIVHKITGGVSTTAFGYNFDWQSRSFYAPMGTPAIVPTAFASQALVEMYEVFDDDRYLTAATEICEFILNGLIRSSDSDDEVCFSYTPNDKTVIYNSSLLAGESLARAGAITQDAEYLDMAAKTARFVTRRQRGDGSWVYGTNASQAWSDNFHTAYVLLSLFRISSMIPELRSETYEPIKTGVDFWLENFFLEDGSPKYYSNEVYPIDIHSAAVAIAALAELNAIDNRMLPLARKVAEWTIENMRSTDGYFYYQIRKDRVVKTPFMRWGQAWMAYALSRLIEAESAAGRHQ
jgi:uncharacterized protein YyaL (SSP411 family)